MTAFTGTGALVRLILRRDRIRLPVWILAIVVVVHASAEAVTQAYSTQTLIDSYAATMGTSPAAVAMAGPPVGLDTIGGIVVNETGVTALIATALMGIFLVVRHTRVEEEEGRTELLRSAVLGRQAPLLATVLVIWAACIVIGLGILASLTSLDLAFEGAVLVAAEVTVLGVVFAAIAACAAQVMTHGRGAVGASAAVLGAAFVLRAVGDVRDGALSWVSPIGWSQAVHAFADPRWWPLAISLLVAVALTVVAGWLTTRRDVGLGLVAPRPGPAAAGRLLGSPAGLALRLQRGSIIGWGVALFLGGVAFGSLSRELQAMVESNPTLAEYFEEAAGATLVDSFLGTAMLVLSLLGAGFAVSSALRIRAEETAGRTEQVLATGVTRGRMLLSNMAVTAGGSAAVVAAGGLGTGIATAVVTDDPAAVARLVGYALVYLPAVLTLAALAVLLVGCLPRFAVAAWAAVAVCFVVGWLGGLLDLPRWVEQASPFTHTPQVPAEQVAIAPLATLLLLAVLGVAGGLVGYRRRDIG